jgi:hypothetical protein
MRRHISYLLVVMALFSGTTVATANEIKAGESCSKSGSLRESGFKIFVCSKKGSKLVWVLRATTKIPKASAPKLLPEKVPVAVAKTPAPEQQPIVSEKTPISKPVIPISVSYSEVNVGNPIFEMIGTPEDRCEFTTVKSSGSRVKESLNLDIEGRSKLGLTVATLGKSSVLKISCEKSGTNEISYEAPKPSIKTITVEGLPAIATPSSAVKYQIRGTIDDECTLDDTRPGKAATTRKILLRSTGEFEISASLDSSLGNWKLQITCNLSGEKIVNTQIAYPKVATTISGIPSEMKPGQKFNWSVNGTRQDACQIITEFPGQSPSQSNLTLSNAGTASGAITLGSRSGNLVFTVSCSISGTATAIAVVTSTEVNVPAATPTTPAATPTTPAATPRAPSSTGRLSKICTYSDAGVPFTTGCQSDTYPFWSLSFCSPRTTSGAWSIYKIESTVQIMKDSGLDSPSMCPDASKPLWITIGDMIPTSTVTAKSFFYTVRWAYILNGKVVTKDYPIRVSVS